MASWWYSKMELNELNPAPGNLQPLPLDRKEQILEAQKQMTKRSIAGVQPKLSTRLSVKNQSFTIADKHGNYILKPELSDYEEVPQNEDLTMRMTEVCGIEVPFHSTDPTTPPVSYRRSGRISCTAA